ncbi:ribosome quality control complex subunit NEMF-like isoform X3 [Ruditapes philippinarum]|uniref:ribosome quality control complex subunit NEMF-like isoform X3 n=1 Tax=Ruditapes philippinarum TaxID=129788 RepID=UPI00295AACF5|nr:ribosome quality control complex subunit NEMF-like isoform X3 [Ruditapes philippinarum]
MKKLKDKYKDQDEEERQLRMEILASAGSKKEDKKKKGKKDEKGRPQSAVEKKPQQQQRKKPELVDIIIKDVENTAITEDPTNNKEIVEAQVNDDDEKLEDDTQTTDDQQILNSLTGIPNIEDELLFALPVCAPYNALTNYKYKVKLLPGSTKRGKAAKIAINMFQYDKTITPRERDLVKISKDVDISRNIPGKVKVTAPNISKVKRK